jgi:hypothetical protein
MRQYELRQGRKVVVITVHTPTRVDARLYVNNGETVTSTAWRGKTTQGAERWAQRLFDE